MNERQTKFIKKLEKHLAQQVSLRQMQDWLAENIKPTLFQLRAYARPGMWLEMYAYREIHWYIDDLEDPTISRGPNLDWYWEEVRRILGLLLGTGAYKQTEYWIEYPFEHKRREHDQWMLPYLEYVEEVTPILAARLSNRSVKLNLPELASVFEPNPLSLRTGSEIIMDKMLSIIRDHEELTNDWRNFPDHYPPIDLESAQLGRLEKLIKCFKGELSYSMSATFEGFDKFAITIVVI